MLFGEIGPPLEAIFLRQNQFTGTLPEDWCFNREGTVEELNVRGNLLTGSIPSGIGSLSILDLDLGENLLSGVLPTELFQMASYKQLFLDFNPVRTLFLFMLIILHTISNYP